MLHLSLIVSGTLIGLALLMSGIVACQIKNKKTTVWTTSTLQRKKKETSWNGNAHYNAPNTKQRNLSLYSLFSHKL